jgi:hypothetical protein
VRGGPKTLIVALVALLLAVGIAACGGGDSSDSSSTTEASAQTQTESKPSGEGSKQAKGKSDSGSADAGSSEKHSSEAGDFVPKQHNDSGGGAEPLKVKGGDNSVQEFGEEAEASEFHAAAAALHNFLDARAEGNWAAACDYMSKNLVESFEKLAARAEQIEDKSCASLLEKLTNPAAMGALKAEAEKADVRSLRTEGEQAFIIYIGTDGTTILSAPMANEAGDWKVASIAGTPLN